MPAVSGRAGAPAERAAPALQGSGLVCERLRWQEWLGRRRDRSGRSPLLHRQGGFRDQQRFSCGFRCSRGRARRGGFGGRRQRISPKLGTSNGSPVAIEGNDCLSGSFRIRLPPLARSPKLREHGKSRPKIHFEDGFPRSFARPPPAAPPWCAAVRLSSRMGGGCSGAPPRRDRERLERGEQPATGRSEAARRGRPAGAGFPTPRAG